MPSRNYIKKSRTKSSDQETEKQKKIFFWLTYLRIYVCVFGLVFSFLKFPPLWSGLQRVADDAAAAAKQSAKLALFKTVTRQKVDNQTGIKRVSRPGGGGPMIITVFNLFFFHKVISVCVYLSMIIGFMASLANMVFNF